MIKLPSLAEVRHQLYKTAKRFPLPTLCSVILAGFGIYMVHEGFNHEPPTWLWQSFLTAMLGLISLTALTLAVETTKNTTRSTVMLAAVMLLGLYWWTLPNDPDGNGSLWITRHIFLCLGSFVALAWAPFWKQNVDNRILWLWCSQLIGNLVVTLFFAGVLFGGTAAALWSIDALFGLDIDGELYGDLWVIVAALFSPLFFLSQFDRAPTKLKVPKNVSAFMGIFTKYIMTPLATGYLVILYAYTAKILITWEWPKNVLGWLVIAFLGVAIFAYFLWTPLLKASWDKYRRIFWLLLIPQIFLLFIAIGWRIAAYSWTENRYFVVVLGLWLLGTTIYFLVRKEAKFKWIFVALTVVILLSQIGPLSGYGIGKTSQTARLYTLLEEATIFKNGAIEPAEIEVRPALENEIASILDYLNDRHGEDTLLKLFPDFTADTENSYNRVNNLMESLGLTYRSKWERRDNSRVETDYFNYHLDYDAPKNITNYDWKVSPQSYSHESSSYAGLTFKQSAYQKSAAITLYLDGVELERISLETKFKAILEDNTLWKDSDLNPENMSYTHESELLSAKIYFNSFYGEAQTINSFDAEVYVRIKE